MGHQKQIAFAHLEETGTKIRHSVVVNRAGKACEMALGHLTVPNLWPDLRGANWQPYPTECHEYNILDVVS